MERERLDVWERRQPAVQGWDQSGAALDGGPGHENYAVRSEVLDYWRADIVSKQVTKDLGVTCNLRENPEWQMAGWQGEGRRLYDLVFMYDGAAQRVNAGDVFAEMCQPYGWAQNDFNAYAFGVPSDNVFRGKMSWIPVSEEPTIQHGRSLRLKWSPDRLPKVVNERPNPGITSGADIMAGNQTHAVGAGMTEREQDATLLRILALVEGIAEAVKVGA